MKQRSCTIRFLFCWLSLALPGLCFTACATEVENPANPEPISPVPKAGRTSNESPNGQTDGAGGVAQSASAPAKTVAAPTKICTVSATRGENNSSGKNGAVITLPDTDAYKNSDLLFRVVSTESFVEVKEQIFGVSPFNATDWVFYFYREDGKSCLVPLVVTTDDITNKKKITLELTIPD